MSKNMASLLFVAVALASGPAVAMSQPIAGDGSEGGWWGGGGGEGGGDGVALSLPGSLGLLAVGLVALYALRNRRDR